MFSSFEFCRWPMLLFASTLLATIVGCANVSSANMVPQSFDSSKHFDKTVQVIVDTKKANDHFKSWVEDAEFKIAIEQSLLRAKLFKNVEPSTADYQLRVTITSVGNFWGLDAKVAVNTIWEVIDQRNQVPAPLWRDTVNSEFTATISDSIGGAKRVKLAYEGALKDNIRKGISQLPKSL